MAAAPVPLNVHFALHLPLETDKIDAYNSRAFDHRLLQGFSYIWLFSRYNFPQREAQIKMAVPSSANVSIAVRPGFTRTASTIQIPAPPVTSPPILGEAPPSDVVLELNDGSAFSGISFGAEGKSVAGECVFQTGKTTPSTLDVCLTRL